MRFPITLTLLSICFTATAQTSPEISKWIYTDSRYKNATGKSVFIQNSLPKGGGRDTLSDGRAFSHVIMWNRIVNESDAPLELTVNFPADSFTIFPTHNAYLKIFLLPETMTLDKVPMFDYGVTGLKSFLDGNFYKPSVLHKTIKPEEEYLFYIAMFFLLNESRGTARTELVLKGNDLFYNMHVGTNKALVPCGKIVFKN